VLDLKFRKKSVILISLMMVGMIFEMLSVGLIIPIIGLMIQKDIYEAYPVIVPYLEMIGSPNQTQLIYGSMTALILLYATKVSFLIFLAWRQATFAFNIHANFSERLFESYLRQPYPFHLNHNSAELIRNNVTEVNEFSFRVLIPALVVVGEGIVFFGIALLLFLFEPLGTSTALGAVFIAGFLYYKIAAPRVAKWGWARQHHEGFRIKHLQQGFGGVKDIILLGREADFINQYKVHSKKSAYVAGCQFTWQQFPRLWFELLSVIALAGLVFAMLAQGLVGGDLILTLGFFAAAMFRMLPSLNRIMGSIQTIRYGFPSVKVVLRELNSHKGQNKIKNRGGEFNGKGSVFQNEINLLNVNFTYEGASKYSLKGVSFQITKGETVGFIGESGSGKSTLIDLILGLLSPNEGLLKVDGKIISDNLRSWQNQIGYVPQSIYLTDDTILKNVAFGVSDEQIDEVAVQHAIAAAQLTEFISQLPDGLRTVVGERGVRLSGGQRQRIGIARALYHDPAILVLDEATSALDNNTEKEVMQAVEKLHGEKTIIIVAHRLSTVKKCDKLFKIDSGRVVEISDVGLI
jgi:ATP-binding cassette, subfamily B, bacterial PglK